MVVSGLQLQLRDSLRLRTHLGRRRQNMHVEDVMSRQVVTIGSSDSCLEAVGRMHRARVRHLPVVNRDGLLVGIVTDRDLRHYLFSPRVFGKLGETAMETVFKAVPVAEIMSTAVISVEPRSQLMEAAQLMLEERIGSLPVVEDGRIVGILTEIDVLRQICRVDSAREPECAEIIVSYP
jgi:CBS domain-containing protein